MGKLIFMWALASPHCLPLQGHWEPSDQSDSDDTDEADSDDIDEAVNTKLLCCFQTHGLGMVMGVEVVGVPGLLYVYYGSGPLKAGKVIVCGLN